ncbi:RNA polymerase sigma factor [Nocardia cyriacigeorgica]|jgi:RNA polymerase sigma-70 factor, ECF subfamily|uniref:RNA polymerase sigma factor n=1 Tax=Nocardia cyriacigeorgica TaxID=135487 RepID=UPI000CEA62D5|nr:sigma-70 family RNA polymerase sigma factor [Nocardia cyriacigeorgica]AVH22750.1 RNA polymerase subunit sigma-24 [Nocardia cyriacigeorgica]MBF6325807.1 sigma-70 family RNA polymerase sigma factor [Nocardia cyriacigeorgica]MBF6498580.1 sigma-70 family RNA polymerase sigma factor [Nocardia cyriacigeorgica]PPJ03408.1 RNA polymerase subunit sigma-24 [Nocardia cyriacigeorgica]
MTTDPAEFDRVYRAEFGRAVATLARLTGDVGLAEDAVQEAFADALRTWPQRGGPDNPGAWITTAARHRALDRLRRESSREAKEFAAARLAPEDEEPAVGSIADDQLRMIFTCCHPALAPESRVALTLRLVCGLRTAEIARAFLQPESTVAQRLSRAKARIRDAGIPLRVPPPQLLPERTPAVLACIYLVFTEGYFATSGPDAVRDELCDEAIRLGTLLCELMPGEPQARALLALMLLTDSRRAQRRGADGELVPLEEQDRRHWDRAKIRAGLSCLVTAAENAGAGKYLAQARIAAAHAVAPNWERTDWAAIVSAYDDLAADAWTPAVAVNRAVAIGFRDGPEAGLATLDEVAGHPRLASSHLVPATRADLLRRAGRNREAAQHYREALARIGNDPAARFLRRRLDEVTDARQAGAAKSELSN